MTGSVCLICFSLCERHTDNGHFLDPVKQESVLSEEQSKESWSLFNLFCEQMHVSLEGRNSCQWDFSKELLPFCSSCKDTVSYISELNSQLQTIQNELSSMVGSLKAKIESSEESIKNPMDVALEQDIDSRISSFRRLLVNDPIPPEDLGVAADSDQDVKPVKRARRSVAKSHIRYQEDSDSDDNFAPEEQISDTDNESNNSQWSPGGEGVSDDEIKVIGNKQGNQGRKSRKKSRSIYSENSRNESDSDDEFKPTSVKKTTTTENTSSNEGTNPESSENLEDSKAKRAKHRHIRQLGEDLFEYSGHKFVQLPEGYKCSVCPNKPFKTRHGIVNHVKHIHLGEKSGYYCQHCGKHCDSPSGLRTHETTHTDIRDCICCECGKGFKNTKNLKRHLKETHKIDLKFLCHKCNKRMKTSEELQAHLRTAHSKDNPMYCEFCGRVFPSALKLKDHVDSHKGETYFRCYYCDTYFLRKDNLKAHFGKEHGVKT